MNALNILCLEYMNALKMVISVVILMIGWC